MSRPSPHAEHDEDDGQGGLSPERLIGAVRRRWKLVAAVTVVAAGLAAVAAWSIPNRYDAAAVVQIDPRKKTISNMDGVISELKAEFSHRRERGRDRTFAGDHPARDRRPEPA